VKCNTASSSLVDTT